MKLGFVIIYVDDVKQTLNFYQNAFNLKRRMAYEDEGVILYGELETEGAILGFASHQMGQMNLKGRYQKTSPFGEPFGQEIVFVTEKVEDTYHQAIEHGAISVAPPTIKPWGQTVAYLRGVEGTLIEVCSPMNG